VTSLAEALVCSSGLGDMRRVNGDHDLGSVHQSISSSRPKGSLSGGQQRAEGSDNAERFLRGAAAARLFGFQREVDRRGGAQNPLDETAAGCRAMEIEMGSDSARQSNLREAVGQRRRWSMA
jgi:hypothetical protein